MKVRCWICGGKGIFKSNIHPNVNCGFCGGDGIIDIPIEVIREIIRYKDQIKGL